MNLPLLLLMLSFAMAAPLGFLGVISGLVLCFVLLDTDGSIKYHLTHWSWWDVRI